MEVHVFSATSWQGEPTESEEVRDYEEEEVEMRKRRRRESERESVRDKG